MTMNIYISKDNEKFLKSLVAGSMSGLINKLLDDYRAGKGPDLLTDKALRFQELKQQLGTPGYQGGDTSWRDKGEPHYEPVQE